MATLGFFHIRRPDRLFGREDFTVLPYSYEHVGATRTTPPEGWNVDRYGGVVGHGADDWARAKKAVDDLVMFDLGWTHLMQHNGVRPGVEVVFAAWLFGVWTVNACRIVYTVDDSDDTRARYGFAYGTLGQHALRGEELFCAEWDKQTDEVRFEVFKFSKPQHLVVQLFMPVARYFQERFNRDCIDRVRREVSGG